MKNKFKLNNIEVDVKRNSLKVNGAWVTIEPRTMDVLTYLARYPKQVISQESLFKALWPNTTFSAGAVQRCIAQLRKALNDDAKKPFFIITHTKRGYSLDVTPKSLTVTWRSSKYVGLMCLLLVGVSLVSLRVLDHKSEFQSKPLTPLTTSSSFDYSPVYSANGNELAFIRKNESANQVIVKNLSEGIEHVLLSSYDDYQSLVWGADNENLYFVVRENNTEWVGKLNLNGTLQKVLSVNKPHRIWKVIDDKHFLYYLSVEESVNESANTKLMRLDKNTSEEVVLIASSYEFTPYRISLSHNRDKIAVAGETQFGKLDIRVFAVEERLLSKSLHKMPLGFTEITWSAKDQSIILAHENRLYSLSLDGEIDELPHIGFQRIFNPRGHPTENKIAMSYTHYKTDLVEAKLGQQTINRLIDSIGQDHLATYSPCGKSVAFVSTRNGHSQIFVLQNGQQILIEENPSHENIYRTPVWSNYEDKLFYSLGSALYEYSIPDNQVIKHELPNYFGYVLDVYSDDDNLLVATKRENGVRFERYDLITKTFTSLANSGVNFQATLDQEDNLVFLKDNKLYWGADEFDMSAYSGVDGRFYSLNNKLLFQSKDTIVSFDKTSFETVQTFLPSEAVSLIDVFSNEKLMFVTVAENRAIIAEYEITSQ